MELYIPMPRNILRFLLILTFLGSLTFLKPAFGLDLKSLAGHAKDPVKGVIDDAQKAANDLLNSATMNGNALTSHAATEFLVVTQSARLALNDDLTKKVEDLNQDQLNILLSLDQTKQWATQQLSNIYDVKDTFVVDATRWESAWIFTHTPDFYVQSIRGTSFLPQAADFQVKMIAYGLG